MTSPLFFALGIVWAKFNMGTSSRHSLFRSVRVLLYCYIRYCKQLVAQGSLWCLDLVCIACAPRERVCVCVCICVFCVWCVCTCVSVHVCRQRDWSDGKKYTLLCQWIVTTVTTVSLQHVCVKCHCSFTDKSLKSPSNPAAMLIFLTRAHTQAHGRMHTSAWTHTHNHVNTHTSVWTHTHKRMDARTQVHERIHTSAWTLIQACGRTHTSQWTHPHKRVDARTQVCGHMHTHTILH